jgi:hypothetical protein
MLPDGSTSATSSGRSPSTRLARRAARPRSPPSPGLPPGCRLPERWPSSRHCTSRPTSCAEPGSAGVTTCSSEPSWAAPRCAGASRAAGSRRACASRARARSAGRPRHAGRALITVTVADSTRPAMHARQTLRLTVILVDAAGRRRSPATLPAYHQGRQSRNKGLRYPADPPTVEEIIAVNAVRGR